MPRQSMKLLTESMFYVLMAFHHGEMCGADAADYVERRSRGRLRMGPATLYTILGKFEQERYLTEVRTEGRKRTYRITEKGLAAYDQEVERLRRCIADAEDAEREVPNDS